MPKSTKLIENNIISKKLKAYMNNDIASIDYPNEILLVALEIVHILKNEGTRSDKRRVSDL